MKYIKKLSTPIIMIALFLISNSGVLYAQKGAKTKAIAPGVANTLGYKITLKVGGKKDSAVILGNYWANKTLAFDTGKYDFAKKQWVFEGKEKAPRGIYFFIFKDLSHFEFIMNDEQIFTVSTDTAEYYAKNLTFIGNEENNRFVQYQAKNIEFGKKLYDINEQIKTAPNDGLKEEYLEKRNALGDTRNAYMESLLKEYPNDVLSKLLYALKPIDVPNVYKADGVTIDTMGQYHYYKNHYWDNIDFKEEALIRTPQNLLYTKIENFFLNVIPQHPDSATWWAENLLSKSKDTKEIDKYFIFRITQLYDSLQMMCMGKTFVHMIDKYYMSTRAFWVDSNLRATMAEAAEKRRYTICGEVALDLNHYDLNGKEQTLYKNKGKYTIIVFYDPTCGHCRTELPIIHSLYQEKKAEGWKVYAISSNSKKTEWEKYIKEDNTQFQDWINVCDVVPYQNWVDNKIRYNINTNPTIMILDSDGRIIAVKIPASNIAEFIERYQRAPEKFR